MPLRVPLRVPGARSAAARTPTPPQARRLVPKNRAGGRAGRLHRASPSAPPAPQALPRPACDHPFVIITVTLRRAVAPSRARGPPVYFTRHGWARPTARSGARSADAGRPNWGSYLGVGSRRPTDWNWKKSPGREREGVGCGWVERDTFQNQGALGLTDEDSAGAHGMNLATLGAEQAEARPRPKC